MDRVVRGLGLCSGGLDSILAALVLKSQGIHVKWISFKTPFFSADSAKYAAKNNDISLYVKNITKEYMAMMLSPGSKFGKNMNPCMDCHSLMFRLAGRTMVNDGFDFMFSGEVLGQRPMSQNKYSLRYVEKHSGYDGYILRPLSAKKLPETIPEKIGMVDRELLLDISGRSRKRQLELASKFEVKDYPSPGGGCLLTDKCYCSRLKDLFNHQRHYSENHLYLLRFGRHMRLNERTKIIIGRNQNDNARIESYVDSDRDIILKTYDDVPGPIVVIPDGATEFIIALAASICVGYSKANPSDFVVVNVCSNKSNRQIETIGLPIHKSRRFLIL